MDPTAVIDVYALIGTPSLWKEQAALVWRVGPTYMFEEALSPDAVGAIYTQGTSYVGNFLALHNRGESLTSTRSMNECDIHVYHCIVLIWQVAVFYTLEYIY